MENQPVVIQNPDIVKAIFEKNSKENRLAKIEGLVQRKIGKRVKWLLDKSFELADGIYTIDARDPDKVKYYKKAPDLDAIIYLIDRLIGKPTAKTENKNTEEKKGVQAVQAIILQLAGANVTINNEAKNGSDLPTITVGHNDVRSGTDTLSQRLEHTV